MSWAGQGARRWDQEWGASSRHCVPRGQQERRRRETRRELAAPETGFNKCLGTSMALLQAEILHFMGLGEEEQGSLKMARAVCRVTR